MKLKQQEFGYLIKFVWFREMFTWTMKQFMQKSYAAINQTPTLLSDAQCHENSTIHRKRQYGIKTKIEKT